jgi:ribosome-associated protein
MLEIAPGIAIDEKELGMSFIRASGPGGQNVNKVATAVQLKFDAARSPGLPEAVRVRAIALAGRRASRDGVIMISAQRYRSQERNRHDAIERLVALLQEAARPIKARKSTRPSRASRLRRLDAKRRRGEIKRSRGGGLDFT